MRGVLVFSIFVCAADVARAQCPNENVPRGRISDFKSEAEVTGEGTKKRLWTPFALPVLTARAPNGEVFAIDLDFAWDRTERPGEMRVNVRCASTRRGLGCPPRGDALAVVSDAATWELKRIDDWVFVAPRDMLAKIPSTQGILFRIGGMLFEFDADGAAKLRRIAPCLLKSLDGAARAAKLSGAEAQKLAIQLANDEADRIFKTKPFSESTKFPLEQKDGRWIWGRVDVGAPGGYSAIVSFDLDGKNPKVQVYVAHDRLDD